MKRDLGFETEFQLAHELKSKNVIYFYVNVVQGFFTEYFSGGRGGCARTTPTLNLDKYVLTAKSQNTLVICFMYVLNFWGNNTEIKITESKINDRHRGFLFQLFNKFHLTALVSMDFLLFCGNFL